MKKKFIRTKDTETWKRLDRFGWFLPLLVFIRFSIKYLPTWASEGMTIKDLPFGLMTIAITTLFSSFPLILLWKALCHQMWKNAVKRSTFHSIEDLDYYREKLTGLSPVTISMLADLRIEAKKDVTATLLQLQMNGIINIDGASVQILKEDDPSLSSNDKMLLNTLANHPLSPEMLTHLSGWKKNEYNATSNSPYFQQKQPLTKKMQTTGKCLGCLSGIVLPILALALFMYIASTDTLKYTFDLIDTVEDDTLLYSMMKTDFRLLLGIGAMFFALLLVIFALIWPIVTIISSIVMVSGTSKIERTQLGEQMTEYVYGMKNFIHDFSSLSEATKEQLILWDDFLIYAVVLEENEQILQEIFGRKSIDYQIIKNL